MSGSISKRGHRLPASRLWAAGAVSVLASAALASGVGSAFAADGPTPGRIAATFAASVEPGAVVLRGQTVTYTLTAQNRGGQDLVGQVLTADLSGVLDDAEKGNNATANIGRAEVGDGILTWQGGIPAGETVTVRYEVVVKSHVAPGAVLEASFQRMGSSTPDRLANPVDGGIVADFSASLAPDAIVWPGQTVTYTLTAQNRGGHALVGQELTADLTGVLDDTDIVHTVTANTGKAGVKDGILTWRGDIPAGETVTVHDAVVVKSQVAPGAVLDAAFQPMWSDTPIHQVNPVGGAVVTDFAADVAPDVAVRFGDEVTYTLTAQNRGGQDLAGQVLTADLTGVLDDAERREETASRGSVDVPDGILTWHGDIPAGETVTITETVRVKRDVAADAVLDAAFQPMWSETPIHLMNPVTAQQVKAETPQDAGTPTTKPSASTPPVTKSTAAKSTATKSTATESTGTKSTAAKAQAAVTPAVTSAARADTGAELAATGADVVGAAALAAILAGAGALLLVARRRRHGL